MALAQEFFVGIELTRWVEHFILKVPLRITLE